MVLEQPLNAIVTPAVLKVLITDVGLLNAVLNYVLHITDGVPTTAAPRHTEHVLEVGEFTMSHDDLSPSIS